MVKSTEKIEAPRTCGGFFVFYTTALQPLSLSSAKFAE